MKKNLIIILSIFVLPLIAYFALTKTTSEAKTVSTVQGKPQIIKFTSTMCLDCQTMNKIFKEIYPKYSNKITLTEIQVADGSSFTESKIKEHHVTLVPTIILIDKNGKQVRRIEGAIAKEEMENCLKELEK